MLLIRFDDFPLASRFWEKSVETWSGFDRFVVLNLRVAFGTAYRIEGFFPELDEVDVFCDETRQKDDERKERGFSHGRV